MPSYRLLSILFFILGLFPGCDRSNPGINKLESYLPAKTQSVLKIEQWAQTQEDFAKHPIFNNLKGEALAQFYKNYPTLIKALHPKGEVLLATEKTNDSGLPFTLIAKTKDLGFLKDSIPNLKGDSLAGPTKIQKFELGKEVFYKTDVDSISLISNSASQLAAIRDGETLKDEGFLTALKVKRNKALSYTVALNGNKSKDSLAPWGSYASYELQLLPDGLIAHGVVRDRDSLGERLSLFRGQQPQISLAPQIILNTAKRAVSMAYSNSDSLRKRLPKTKEETSLHPIFETTNELVWVKTASSSYCALNSLDSNLSWESLAASLSELESYRDIQLYRLSEMNSLFKPFRSIVPAENYGIAFPWEDFLVFTVNEEQAKELISGLFNKSVVSETGFFQNTATHLAQSASLVFYEMEGRWDELTAALFRSDNSQLKGFPIIVTQLIYDRDFAHLNIVAKSGKGEAIARGPVQQLMSLRLESELLGTPKFFSNHNTGGKDIVAQDRSNQLYLISTNGKVLWTKKLDGPILGEIHEIDILRNGKKQLAFSTQHSVYVLDRNGNAVAPFPKKFKDPITQPLAIFDYDSNRKYRFVVVQNDRLYMYDTKGESVKGFTFSKAGSKIVLPPQHLRIGNKDYITVAEASGKLNLLSRVGKIRVPVNRNLSFSELPIEKEGSNFVVITSDKQKVSIDQNGGINAQPLDVSDTYWFTIYGNTKLTLDDNLMRINGKLTELPAGIYSKPQLLPFGKNLYAAITETKEHAIYVYSKNGTLLPNFPIYGSSEIDLADANRNGSIHIVVQGEKNEVLLYQLPK